MNQTDLLNINWCLFSLVNKLLMKKIEGKFTDDDKIVLETAQELLTKLLK